MVVVRKAIIFQLDYWKVHLKQWVRSLIYFRIAEGTIESFGFNIRGPDAYFLAAIEEVVVNQVNDELVGYSEIAKMSYPYISYEISQECMNFLCYYFLSIFKKMGLWI